MVSKYSNMYEYRRHKPRLRHLIRRIINIQQKYVDYENREPYGYEPIPRYNRLNAERCLLSHGIYTDFYNDIIMDANLRYCHGKNKSKVIKDDPFDFWMK